jgi:hypothetical protein
MKPTIDKLKLGDIIATEEMIRNMEIVAIRGNYLIIAFAGIDWSKEFLGLQKLDVQVLIDSAVVWWRDGFDMLNDEYIKDTILMF